MPNTVQRQTLAAEAAKKLIAAAEKKAEEIKKPMVIAVTDESGNLKAFSRMDNAPLLSVQIAQDKAYTAISFGIATHQWYEFIKNDPPLLSGIVHTPRLIVFGGGYPITINGQVVGGIGVSGGHYTEDMQVAEAALKSLEK
ncbi:MAG: heme-binding protein [Acidobacteria bacterium]|nr:heme-binding protein [Acidobacteriota bacterium]